MKSTDSSFLIIALTTCFAVFAQTQPEQVKSTLFDFSKGHLETVKKKYIPRHDSKILLGSPFRGNSRSVGGSKNPWIERGSNVLHERNEIHDDSVGSLTEFDSAGVHPTHSTLERPKRAVSPDNKLEQVTIEVERLFDSLNKRRSEIEHPRKTNENENEITVVIENDGEDDSEEQAISTSKRSEVPDKNGPGFAIILDNTNGNEASSTPQNTAEDFTKMSRSYDAMKEKFEMFLSEEKNSIPRNSPPISRRGHGTEGTVKQSHMVTTNPTKPTERHLNIVRSTIEADIEKLKKLRERLQMESAAIDAQEDERRKELRSKTNGNWAKRIQNIQPNVRDGMARETRREKISGEQTNSEFVTDSNLTKAESPHSSDDGRKLKFDASERSEKDGRKATGRPNESKSTGLANGEKVSRGISLRTSKRYYPTHTATTAAKAASRAASNVTSSSTKEPKRVIYPRKASAMIEYLNKDPLESWFYKFQSLSALGLNSTMLRNGLVNPGSIDRLKNVMVRALKGDDITLSVVGGSISAGGGLYKDEGNIGGLYYKGVVDWWNKVITPLTGSEMKVNNIAIGSIGTDYFSYCLRSHISNESDIIIWELSGNDYNRYLKTSTKGAKPLERFTRMALQVPSNPAIIFVNFFKGVDYKKSKKSCPNFEDQGEDIIAHYYKIPSLSWRAMVCESLIEQNPLFTLNSLFCKDQYHPSLLGHAQTSLLLILHLRHVMRSVLQYASSHDGILPDFNSFYTFPAPLFVGLEHPVPLCWTLISPDFKESLNNNLGVKILTQNGFKIEYATNFPIRFDRVICWRAEIAGALMKMQITLPEAGNKDGPIDEPAKDVAFEIAITTHTRFGGSAEVWLDQRPGEPMLIKEGRPNDTGKRTQVDVITQHAEPGVHTLNLKAITSGFCLASIMVS